MAEGRRGQAFAGGTSLTSLGRRRGPLGEYALLKDLRKRLSVGCDRHLVPAEGLGPVERFIGFPDRGAKVTPL